MQTLTGIGYSTKTDSFAAGEECAAKALQQIGSSPISIVIVFCSGKYNPEEFLAGVLSVTGKVPLIGGAAFGVFTNTELSYEAYEATATIISSATITFQTFSQSKLNEDEYAAGIELSKKINEIGFKDPKGLFVFYDTAKSTNPPLLNFATPLFAAIEEQIDPSICCVGAGLMGDLQLTSCFQFLDDMVLHQHALGLLVGGECMMYNNIMHGCMPASSYKTITKAEGPVIFEIDNRPALDIIDELFGEEHKVSWNAFPLFVTLGLNKGDKYGEFKEQDYANRVCLAVDIEQKALIMFEPDLKPGDEVQLMHRSINLDYLQSGIDALKQQATGKKPLLYFYINCGGRAKPFAGGDLEDVTEIQNILGNEVPFMGFYSGVEVAKLGSHLQALDWTGVLCILTEA